jgi:uncharacterized membrane protein
MPYNWTTPQSAPVQELHLWPHQSLPAEGFVAFIGATFALLMVPLIPLMGTVVLWGILPFLMAALGGIWFALGRSRKRAQVLEVLTLTDDQAHLLRRNPRGDVQEWDCNRYWVQPRLHEKGGPVPYYITLKGHGREVEIGAFLSEDERKSLYEDLQRTFLRG